MTLHAKTGNLLDAEADAIIIAVDGDDPKLLGSVGQQLRKRIDDEDYWQDLIRAANYPIHPGDVRLLDISTVTDYSDAVFGYRAVILVNFYNHINSRVYYEKGYHNALAYAHHNGLYRLGTALYKGGWRGTEAKAMAALKRAAERVPEVDVTLCVRPTCRIAGEVQAMLARVVRAPGMTKENATKQLVRALIASRLRSAMQTPVAGLDGVSVVFGGEAESPRRLYVTSPDGRETYADFYARSDEEFAEDVAKYLGLAGDG